MLVQSRPDAFKAIKNEGNSISFIYTRMYYPFLVYCRELASGTVSLTCDRAHGDDSKHDSHYRLLPLFGIHSVISLLFT